MRHLLTLLLLLIPAAFAVGGPNEALAAAVRDARTLPRDQQVESVYFYVGNLPASYREEALKVLSYRVNSLSTEPELAAPKVASAEVLRVNRTDYGWKREVWEKLVQEPYFHQAREVEETEQWGYRDARGNWYGVEKRKTGRKAKKAVSYGLDPALIAELITLTQSQVPFVRADWWFAQVSRQVNLSNKQTGIGYYDFLNVKNRADFERIIGLDVDASIRLGKEMRAAVEFSGVSQNNRQIERYQTLTGGAYRTLDTDDSTGAGDAIVNLKRGTFKHLAEESYGTLPCGLFIYVLNDAEGKLQASAPDFIGFDSSPLRRGHDGKIHVGIACERCHTLGLQSVDDWVRRQAKSVNSTNYKDFLEFKRQYLSPLTRQIEKDRLVYAETLKEVNGLAPAENARAVAAFFHRYVDEAIGPDRAAEELGITKETLLQRLAAYKAQKSFLNDHLAGLLAYPPVPIRRDQFEQTVPELLDVMGGKY